MTKLLAPRVIKRAGARHRSLELDEKTFVRAEKILSRALAGGKSLTRPEAYQTLARAGIAPDGQRGIHMLAVLSMRGVLCIGPHRGKQPAFVLCDEWLPKGRDLDGDEALGELARRYFTSHGPATDRDFSWWTGLNLGEARRAIDIAGEIAPPRAKETKMAALLPPFDEYTVAYRDRSAVGLSAGVANLMSPIVLVDGKVAGTWKRSRSDVVTDVKKTPLVRAAIDRFVAFTK
ncbi:MAG TPA: crosslink repair DNA glycosylase YcaQ family protein [Polyangiaceae bacterium]